MLYYRVHLIFAAYGSDKSGVCPARPSPDQLKLEKVAPEEQEGAMRKDRFMDEPRVGFLREVDREPVALVVKRHGVNEQTLYTWRWRSEP